VITFFEKLSAFSRDTVNVVSSRTINSTATGSDGARIRGDHDQTVRHRTAGAPYYGPVTVDQGPESDDDTVGLAAS